MSRANDIQYLTSAFILALLFSSHIFAYNTREPLSIHTRHITPLMHWMIVEDPKQLTACPTVIAHEKDHLISTAGSEAFVDHGETLSLTSYDVVEPSAVYYHPITQEYLAHEVEKIGEVKVLENKTVARVKVEKATKPIETGTKLMVKPLELPSKLFVRQSKVSQEGFVVGIKTGLAHVGRRQVIVISLGTREGLMQGDKLSIFQTRPHDKYVLPDRKAAEMVVVRVFEKIALGVILNAKHEVALNDKIRG